MTRSIKCGDALPGGIWTDPDYAKESLPKVVGHYVDYLGGRSKPVSPSTLDKYQKTLLSFMRSLACNEQPLILSSITPRAVSTWIREQRDRGLTEDGIATRLGALKTFTNKYLYLYLELTTRDLLYKVPRFTPPDKLRRVLTPDEIDAILKAFDRPTFQDTRDRALIACYIATGLRLREIIELPLDALDRNTGAISFIRAKGGNQRCAMLSRAALKYVTKYLELRPGGGQGRLWLRADGESLSYGATHPIMDRIRKRTGIARLHWHLFRHGFAQHALMAGADIGTVQEMLGHASNAMTRRYAGHARQVAAARLMPRYSPI